ncbi:MAG: ATP-binding protein [bacterium]|nr:ATP-binding protein [bacterium]
MKKKEYEIALDFVSNIKLTEFCVLVFSYIKSVLNIQEEEFFKTEISLREVINNAILHGNKSDMSKRVHVKFRWSKSWLRIRIKDENNEKVDFNAISQRLQNNDLLSFNGRGLLIMQSYMDSVEFFPSNNGTEIVMEKKL